MIPVFTSESHEQFRRGLEEIHRLQQVGRTSNDLPIVLVNALHRASTVILCSRVEAYLEQVFVEGWEFLESKRVPGSAIPSELRARIAVHESNRISNMNREAAEETDSLAGTIFTDLSHLWDFAEPFSTQFAHIDQLARHLNSPDPRNVTWFFKPYGIVDIFSEVERTTDGRIRASTIAKNLDDFVQVRHRIAHGDERVVPTPADVSRYLEQSHTLCREVDAALGLRIEGLGYGFPWRGRPRRSLVVSGENFLDWVFV